MDIIHIALPSDENYVPGLTVTAASIALYADPATPLHLHILDGGIQDATFDHFSACIRRIHEQVEITRHPIDEAAFASLPAWSGNRMTYARLMLPQALPEVEFVIYSDTDMLWLAPVEALWAKRKAEKLACVVRDGYPETEAREAAWFARKGFPFDPERYFCAGLLLLNLKLMREERIVQRTFDFLAEHPDCQFADQTAFNVLLRDRATHLPRSWQVLTRLVRREDFDAPVVLHFGGDIPWKRHGWWSLLSDPVMLWHRFNDVAVLGGRGRSLSRYFTRGQRFYKRALCLVLNNTCFRWVFYGVCRWTGRGSYCGAFEETRHPIRIRSMRQLYLHWNDQMTRGGYVH